jgi:hypothetical protein
MGSPAAWDTIQLTRKHSGQGKSVILEWRTSEYGSIMLMQDPLSDQKDG